MHDAAVAALQQPGDPRLDAALPLELDLIGVREVITWHSAAALAALPAWGAFEARAIDAAQPGALASLDALPQGAVVGTSSLRRVALLRLQGLRALPRMEDFEALLAEPGPWLGAFDFPFGLPRAFVQAQDLQAQHLFVDAPLAAGQSLELTLWTLDSRGALGQQQHLYLQVVI